MKAATRLRYAGPTSSTPVYQAPPPTERSDRPVPANASMRSVSQRAARSRSDLLRRRHLNFL